MQRPQSALISHVPHTTTHTHTHSYLIQAVGGAVARVRMQKYGRVALIPAHLLAVLDELAAVPLPFNV